MSGINITKQTIKPTSINGGLAGGGISSILNTTDNIPTPLPTQIGYTINGVINIVYNPDVNNGTGIQLGSGNVLSDMKTTVSNRFIVSKINFNDYMAPQIVHGLLNYS